MCAILNGVSYHGLFPRLGCDLYLFSPIIARALDPIGSAGASCRTPTFSRTTQSALGKTVRLMNRSKPSAHVRLMQTSSMSSGRPIRRRQPGAFVAALRANSMARRCIALTRQNVPMLNEIDAKLRREGVRRGGYIAKHESAPLDLIILSCGSELQHALAAAKELGAGTRVVSMPCMERFNREAEEYREEVLPTKCRRRVAIEAGVPEIWYQYVGLDGKVIGLHRFGLSAPGAEVMKEFGIDAQHVVDAARSLS